MTPDSFFDGGVHNSLNKAISYTRYMIKNGAKIIDIGGESTRPKSKKITIQEELDRVIPIIESIAKRFNICISVDTYKPQVMLEAAKVGAHMINDVKSLSEAKSIKIISKKKLYICITHSIKQNKPKNSISNINIVENIKNFFLDKFNLYEKCGIKKNRIFIDPGFGYEKSLNDNYKLLSELNKFNVLKKPILVGFSRKSMIGNLLNIRVQKRLIGSVICATIALLQGAKIIRVHDVKETKYAINIAQKIFSINNNKYFHA